jgi:DNA-directed RNA polymerase subunit F
MYRKSLEMSEQQTSPATHPKIVDRVAELPVVTSASEVVSHYYTMAKESHPAVKSTLETAEKVVKYAAETAKPVVEKLERPISVVDDLACKTLDKVEETFPVIKHTPEEIAKGTKELIQPAVDRYNSVKQYGIDRANAARDLGNQKVAEAMQTQYGQAAASAMSAALSKADQCVDYFLPGEVDEKLKVENLQKRTQETLAHLNNVLEMAQNAKNYTNQAMQERYNTAQQKAQALWEEVGPETSPATRKPSEKLSVDPTYFPASSVGL